MMSSSENIEPNKKNKWFAMGMTAVIYLVLGALGLSFAIAPGYASPIFPAAGFAVAALLWSKQGAWAGIFLGSMTMNLIATWLHGNLHSVNIWVSISIALGSTLQALVACWLVNRFVKEGWQTLETLRDIFLCLVLAGPLACLISTSVGITTLYLANIVSAQAYLYSWWSWWLGDALGVLVMLPLSLRFFYREQASWRARLTTVVFPMVITLVLVASAFFTVSQWERAQQQQVIQKHGETLAELLKQRFIAHQEAIAALRRVIEVTPDISFQQFEYYTRVTLQDNPDIFALSINPYVTQIQRTAFERTMTERMEITAFQIKEKDSQGALIRAKERADYITVGYIAPLEGNRQALGYDINSEPIRHDAIQRAMRTMQPAVTSPIHLVQEHKKRVGILVLHPAFQKQVNAKPNRNALIGFAVGVIKADEMIQIATQAASIPGLVFQIDDTYAPDDKPLIYISDSVQTSTENDYQWTTTLTMADRVWTLTLRPTTDYLSQQHHWIGLSVGAGGLALAALLQILLLVTTGSTAIVQRKVLTQTAELQSKSDILEDRNAQLNAMFLLSPDAFVAFSPDGRIKFVNPAFRMMTDIATEEIIGKSEENLEAELYKRCEHPENFRGIAPYFADEGENKTRHPMILIRPRYCVLQIVGIHSQSSSIARILYLRDITRESEVDRMKSEFLAHAAHELRTPMTSIFGFSELLLKMDFDEPTRLEMLQTIYQQTKWLVDIINELLDLVRIESRRGKDFNLESVEISELLKDVTKHFKPPEGRDSPLLSISLTDSILGDRKKIFQALMNVLSNAYKYSPNGGDVRIGLVDSALKPDKNGMVGICISDRGIGMTTEQLERVFERFFRADSTGKIPGTGLGMSIVKEIVEMHGGKIDFVSQYGVGSTVTLWFPMSAPCISIQR